MTVKMLEPYRPRPIRYLGLWEERGWRLKLYGAAYNRDCPRPPLVEALKAVARQQLPQPAEGEGRYGVGFMCAHDGRGGAFAFVDWWADENELHHHLYTAPEASPEQLRPVGPDALTACVWDLAVMAFERQAWLEAVLQNPAGPDLDRYLSLRLEADV